MSPLDQAEIIGSPLADPDQVAAQVLAAQWQPPPPIDYRRWARENVVFGTESPFPGPYNPKLYPWNDRIFFCLSDQHPSRTVSVKGSAQIGKTVIAQVFAGGSLDMDPGPFLYVHPTENNGRRWSLQKWKVFVRKIRSLSRFFRFQRSNEASSGVMYQERTDGRGFIQISGANSEASMSMMSMPRQVQDDLAKWEMNDAGDPEEQAANRSKAFTDAKILKISTPMLADNCRITANYNQGTQEQYHVVCPHCRHLHPLVWQNFKDSIGEESKARPYFTCPDCGGIIEEKHRPWIVDPDNGATWVADNPDASDVSFYLWAAYVPSESWSDLANKWRRAEGDPAKEQTFLNDDVGLAYEAEGEAPPWKELKERADATGHDLGTIPVGGILLTLGVDCQGDRVEWHLKAFGRDLKRWTIEYDVIQGHISDAETRKNMDALLKRTWPDAFGNRRSIDMLAIDANYSKTDVLDWCKRHPQSRVIAVRGAKGDQAPALALVEEEKGADGKKIKKQRRFWNVGQSPLKVSFYKNLTKTDPTERGYCAYPTGLEEEFFRQLASERRQPVKTRGGYEEWRWVKIKGQANEVLDTEIYAEAAAIRLGWRRLNEAQWDELESQREKPPEHPQLDLEQPDLSETISVAVSGAGPTNRPRRSGRSVTGPGRQVR